MKLRKKKGFTIVELVIVIAVIAILAAVLIPTFANLIARANESADIQAVKEMNTQLAIAEVDSTIATIGDAINALKKVNINMENYTPLRADTQFYWVKSLNRVIYVDLAAGNKVLFPKEYENLTQEKGDWYALNGKIKYEDYAANISDEGGSKTLSVSSAGQFASFINDYNSNNAEAKAVTKIVLSNDIDLAGATCKFTCGGRNRNYALGGQENAPVYLTIDGGSNTIYGFRDDSYEYVNSVGSTFGYGFFGSIGYFDNVTIQNVKFSGMHIENTQTENARCMAFIAGYLFGNLTLTSVEFEDCTAVGYAHVGAIVGQDYGPNLKMSSVTFKNTTISGTNNVAKIIGDITGRYNLEVNNCDFDGINVVDRFGWCTVKQSDIKATDGTALPFLGDEASTTYFTSGNTVYAGVTNDWVWYYTDANDKLKDGAQVKIGENTYSFSYYCDSASKNIVNGVPAN